MSPPPSGSSRHADTQWESSRTDGSPPRSEPAIRRILLESLPEDTVQWAKKLVSATSVGDGRHELTFTDCTSATTDILVGADGTWSKVRPLLSDEKPTYAGLSYVDSYLHDVDELHPEIAETVGEGAMYAILPGKGLLSRRKACAAWPLSLVIPAMATPAVMMTSASSSSRSSRVPDTSFRDSTRSSR
jgi:2-polyprenyl-6-methoxyphenol hydroxylase-like FAD-dependent oxidoreductase